MRPTEKIIAGILALLIWCGDDVMAQPETGVICSQLQLQNALSAYNIGRFSTTFQTLSPCLPTGFSERTQRSQAWRLMALSYLAVDSLGAAEQSVRALLRANKRFRPNPQTEPPLFVDLVQGLKPKWHTWLWRGGEWYKWAGRGILVSAAVTLPSLLKKDQLGPLPGPPETPIRN